MSIEATKIISNTTNIICLLFVGLLTLTYFSKKRINNAETQIYKTLLIITLINLGIEMVFYFMFQRSMIGLLLDIVEKCYYIANLIWVYIFTIYTITITKPFKESKVYRWSYKLKKVGIITTIAVLILLVSFAKIERFFENGILLRSSGSAPGLMFIFALLMVLINIILTITRMKKIERKKTLPLFLFIGVIFIELMLSMTGTQLLLITLSMSLVVFLMYNTIENPDVKMLEEVSLAKEAAERANNAKTDFLSNMSHEIRTPLNAIVGFSESLKDDNIIEEAKEKVEDIIMASNNLLDIVNGILDISKIEANKLEIINKEYDIYSMLDELIALTKARIGDRSLEFRANIDKSIPSVLYGDNIRLKQIILNILTNAVKYTKEGFVELTVSSVIKDNVCRLIISVEDSGIGIKEESLPKLFSKFERLNVEKSLTIEGTGLGLAITKKLVELMNGKIVVQSVYGQGSKFTVSIDQRIIAIEKPLIKETKVSESKVINANGAKILIVDDNELNIKVASTLLKKYNFKIDSATSGYACLEKINKKEEYDIIFLDDMMPKMSGRDTIKRLKNIPNFNTPVIALTANAIEGMKQEYLDCGFDDYLSKPIEKLELERVIKTYINNQRNTETGGVSSNTANSIISIPEEEKNQENLDLPKIRKENSLSGNQLFSGKKILVVDDDELNLKVANNFLKKYDCEITLVKSGSECISKVIENTYNLIFMDDKMPELDGCKTFENLKMIEDFNTPTILLTASSSDEVEDKIKSYGFSGYIGKPLDKDCLENVLYRYLN